MPNTHVLISGASVAGPALAHWLSGYGFRVTVVERAPALRPGGQAVDFKGRTHHTVLDRMGVREEIHRRRTHPRDQYIVDANGRRLAAMPAAFTGGDVEIRRGDLSALLYERTRDTCEYVFGDSITSITETAGGVHVTFERAAPRTFDLVVGADGIHSNVRRLAFGPESRYVRYLGYHYALAEIAGDFGPDPLIYNEPGRHVSVGGAGGNALLVFASAELRYDRHDTTAQQRIVTEAFEGMGWRAREVIRALPDSTGFYFDSISRVVADRYAQGRVALLGDAAYGNTLGGFGTGLAMVGAYVLAGELAVADGDHGRALRRYEERFRGYAGVARKGNGGRFLAPSSRRGIRARNLLFKSGFLFGLMMRMTDKFATDIDLPDYPSEIARHK
ncbi:FAD-dependent oxidoreductase [Spongiactinospora rosea]|uniref:FAD-dependent oxidoreductase n=1 Tax=Spongiactinospora rosea TaxID=2248750 RepID=A0A366LNQ1_9ACTN|nr:FAD-dependent monooxygenase [Spongiactinospora rosea]RBQ15467.1 FAD-dependent oxidoreductase [Spongiactinospora rosea]